MAWRVMRAELVFAEPDHLAVRERAIGTKAAARFEAEQRSAEPRRQRARERPVIPVRMTHDHRAHRSGSHGGDERLKVLVAGLAGVEHHELLAIGGADQVRVGAGAREETGITLHHASHSRREALGFGIARQRVAHSVPGGYRRARSRCS